MIFGVLDLSLCNSKFFTDIFVGNVKKKSSSNCNTLVTQSIIASFHGSRRRVFGRRFFGRRFFGRRFLGIRQIFWPWA
jgi:hypothetical protein